MSGLGDPALLTIGQAQREIRARRLSAVELTSAVLARVERLNPALNAYLRVDAETALAQARAADGSHAQPALHGVPVCVKDVIDVAGVPTTAGAASWRRTPKRDASAVARLRAAGAIVIGKGHTNEFAYGIDGQNPHWGNCSNPYDPARICGGSSSGPAVATASGMALAGLGTDTSGSVRMPASLCGLVGVRPTFGLVPRDGVVPLAWSFDTVGPLARSVEDATLLLEVLLDQQLQGPESGSVPSGLRLGVAEQLMDAAESYVASGITEAMSHLERHGVQIVPIRFERLRYTYAVHQLMQHAEAAQVHAPWFEAQQPHYSEPVRTRLEAGQLLPAAAYLAAQQARRLVIEEVAEKMTGLDALLAPAAPLVAPLQGAEEVTIRGVSHALRQALQACVLPAAQLGSAALSVPVGAHEGLPYGMQLIGRPHSEELLLRIASVCEERWPWDERRPAV